MERRQKKKKKFVYEKYKKKMFVLCRMENVKSKIKDDDESGEKSRKVERMLALWRDRHSS